MPAVLLRRALLALVLLIAAFARFDHLGWGLPRHYHPDEGVGVSAVRACRLGRPHDPKYRHPPLLHSVACVVDRHVVAPYTARNLPGMSHETLSLRVVSAAVGVLTCLFVYLLAMRVGGYRSAVAAAALFAIFPSAVLQAKYGVPDSLLTMLMTAALWLQLRMLEQPRPARYFAAALVTALATTAKYNGAFVAISFVAAHALAARQGRVRFRSARHIGSGAAAVAAGLAVGFPRVLFGNELGSLASGMLFEQQHLTQAGHHGIAIGALEGGYVFHFVHSILPGAGPVLLALIVAGLAVLAGSAAALPAALVLLAFAVPYYVTIETIYKVPPSFERYPMPLVPIYLIGAMGALELLVARLPVGLRAAAVAAALVITAWHPARLTYAVTGSLSEDTRDRMSQWMRDRLGGTAPFPTVSAQWPTMAFYYPRPLPRGRIAAANARTLQRRPPGEPIYVLASSLLYQRYLDYPADEPAWTRFYERLFAEGELVHEEDAPGVRYMFHNPTVRLYRMPDDRFRSSR